MNTSTLSRLCPAFSFRHPGTLGSFLALLAIFAGPAFAAPTPPAAPTGLIATAGGEDVTLKWNASADAKSYRVFRGNASEGESARPLFECDPRDTRFSARDVRPGKTYFYEVRAVNKLALSRPSKEVSATPYKHHETVGGGRSRSTLGRGRRWCRVGEELEFRGEGHDQGYADMNANFFYHDQFGTIGNGTNYGAITIAPDDANAIHTQAYDSQPHEGPA